MMKQVQKLYDYSQSLDFLPPRGDGAKDAVAKEIHDNCVKVFNKLEKNLEKNPKKFVEGTYMLLELVERMLLDKIDGDYTPEEMMAREELGIE